MKEQQKTEFRVEVYLGDILIPDEELHNLQLCSYLAHSLVSDSLSPESESTSNNVYLFPVAH